MRTLLWVVTVSVSNDWALIFEQKADKIKINVVHFGKCMSKNNYNLHNYMSRPILQLKTVFNFLVVFIFFGCQKSDPYSPPPVDPWKEVYTEFNYSVSDVVLDSSFGPFTQIGSLENPALNENSGLAACTYRNDWLYGHNDGGDSNRFFVFDTTGKNIRHITVPGFSNRDCEDMGIDHNPIDGKKYMYLADFGDNNAVYPEIYIYRFAEPILTSADGDTSVPFAEKLTFVYPDGPRDAETLLVDPWSHHLYIITKREAKARVYKAEFPFIVPVGQSKITLQKVAQLPFSGLVGGDISPDGRQILLKNYGQIFIWDRNEGEPITSALSKQPKIVPYKIETQGEAVCWSNDSRKYYTVGEGKNALVYSGSR